MGAARDVPHAAFTLRGKITGRAVDPSALLGFVLSIRGRLAGVSRSMAVAAIAVTAVHCSMDGVRNPYIHRCVVAAPRRGACAKGMFRAAARTS